MFEPYIIQHGFKNLDFFIATPLARDWYDPPKGYALLEYQWVIENIPLKGKVIVDGGCHHGHYSLVLAKEHPRRLIMVDPHIQNLDVAEVNLFLNCLHKGMSLRCAALWNQTGKINYDGQSNGAISFGEGIEIDSIRLADLNPKVVKLDIEGAEYVVVPDGLATCNVDSWIIEAHSGNQTEPNAQDHLARLLKDDGYELDWVNREKMVVERYKLGTIWPDHSTLFARR